jgi:carbon-monoxide dehydrogenase medium subunit
MKPPPLSYIRPRTLEDAVQALQDAGEDARPLAGGQSLVPMLNFRLARPSVLVDVAGLPELQEIRPENGTLVVGASVRQRTAELSPVVRELCPILPEALGHVGHLQIRTRGTVGGSIAHADPAAELPAVALALDAELTCAGPAGERTIPASEFFFGPYWSALEPGEILTAVRFPLAHGAHARCIEIARRSGDFAVAGLAGVVELDGGTVTRASLAAFGVGAVPERLAQAEQALAGQRLDADVVAAAASAAAGEIDPSDDGHGDADYRRHALSALVTRFLEEARP